MLFSTIVLNHCGHNDIYLKMIEQKHNDTILKELNGKYYFNILDSEDISTSKANIVFDSKTNKVSGFLGCNRFFGNYILRSQALELGKLGTTKMICEKEQSKIEKKLLKVFKKARLVYFKENGFSLYNKNELLLTASKK